MAYSKSAKKLITGQLDGWAVTWNVEDFEDASREQLYNDRPVHCLALSPDGKTLASASQFEEAQIWDFPEYRLKAKLKSPTKKPECVSFAPDDKWIACGYHDGSIKLWDSRTFEAKTTVKEYDGQVTRITWSPDSKYLVSTSHDGIVKIWQVK